MSENYRILFILIAELIIFLLEIILAVKSRKNKVLRNANTIEDVDFIDLNKGCRTGISFFRLSVLIAFLFYIIFSYQSQDTPKTDSIFLFIAGFVLIFLLSVFNIRTFYFLPEYFVVASPFRLFMRSTSIHYADIEDFTLYKALYNSNILHIVLKNGKRIKIQFAGASNPRNDFLIRVILNSKTDSKQDFSTLENKEEI